MKTKVHKCKYCGASIVWEKDYKGKSHAVERTLYYTPDPHGNILVLTARGEIVRAVEDKKSNRVGNIMHSPRCAAPPRYITANKKKTADYLEPLKSEEKAPAEVQEDNRTKLSI
jgi:hypothetical protein